MIIVKLLGGLGNQLFQYAAGKRLAYVNGASLKIDVSGFQIYKLHKYSLQHFNIVECFATPEEVDLSADGGAFSRLSKLFLGRMPRKSNELKLLQETQFHFDPRVLTAGDNILLDGYWQSEAYFKDVSDIIRNEFNFRCEPDSDNEAMAREISGNSNSVSVHFRRADYITNGTTNAIHGVCPVDYYMKAIDKMALSVKDPHLYIFSDDIDWVSENIRFKYDVTFATQNGPDKNYEDLRLMSLCRHNIIANSSFSWWGAWLNSNPHKIVIAPSLWFKSTEHNTTDLLPGSWIRL